MSELRALSAMLDPEVFDDSLFGFHAQQVAEKTLKAWISGQGVEYPKTHDLGLLLSILTDRGQAVDDLGHLIELNVFAVQFRYEAFEELGEPVDRPATILALQALVGRVEEQLGSL